MSKAISNVKGTISTVLPPTQGTTSELKNKNEIQCHRSAFQGPLSCLLEFRLAISLLHQLGLVG